MSNPVILSVDGPPALDEAANRDAHLAGPHAGQQVAIVSSLTLLVNRPCFLNGGSSSARKRPKRQGWDKCPRTSPGTTSWCPRGRPGGVRVNVLAQDASNQVPTVTEILPRGNVLLTAKGGDGEPGRQGGDGQSGMPGTAGRDATQHTEATVSHESCHNCRNTWLC
jgi:hypothetical protein